MWIMPKRLYLCNVCVLTFLAAKSGGEVLAKMVKTDVDRIA